MTNKISVKRGTQVTKKWKTRGQCGKLEKNMENL